MVDAQVLDELQTFRHVPLARAAVFALSYGVSAYTVYWIHLQTAGGASSDFL